MYRTDAQELEAAIQAVDMLIRDAEHSGHAQWTGSGADTQLIDCDVEQTPAQCAAARTVGAAYLNLATALRNYRSASKGA